jgi:hypothetical protein
MDITIGSYKLRLEYAIIIVFLIVVIFGHTMCSCRHSELLEGFEQAKKQQNLKIGFTNPDKKEPGIAGPKPTIAAPVTEGFSNYKTNAGPQFAENNSDFTHLPVSQWTSVVNVGPQNANQPSSSDSMDFFANTQFKPECCPNTYSGSEGCACMSNSQYNTLISRGGNNVPYSEY